MKQPPTTWAIDASNWLSVDYYANAESATERFLSRIRLIEKTYEPAQIYLCFDGFGAAAARRSLWPEYKQNRTRDNSLHDQIDKVQLDVEMHGLPIETLRRDGIEADDWLASIAAQTDGLVVLGTHDKDVNQCLEDGRVIACRAVRMKPGPRLLPAWFSAADLRERYQIEPQQWVDFQSLVGDTADNVPGCKGIGEVQARKWLTKHGDLDGIFRALDTTQLAATARQMELLREFRPLAERFRELFRLERGLKLCTPTTT